MKLVAVSDNHGNTYYMEEIRSIYEKEVTGWIHCGDSELLEDHPLWQHFKTVEGNMDIADGFKIEEVAEFEGEKCLIAHGHRHAVKRSYEELKQRAEEEGCRFVFYGHTHIPRVDKIDGIFFINPGSITQPRDRELGTYVVMDLDTSARTVSFSYYDRDHNPVNELSESFSFND
ncbi:MAG: metallophosphoesterase [Alkalibacterium sp.]|nr:metallophosphoesterase [Alkalibacterium sp.]